MIEETPNENGETQEIEERRTITYHQYGFRSAKHSNSRPESIDDFLDNVYEKPKVFKISLLHVGKILG